MAKEFSDYYAEEADYNGNIKNWEAAQRKIDAATLALGADRHIEYGSGNILRHGLYGIVVRVDDKMERMAHMINKGNMDSDKLSDAAADVINYMRYFIMMLNKEWELPMEADLDKA